MDFLNGKIKTLYFKYLAAAFGSALITSIYYYESYTGHSWGDRLNYDLCINTTQTIIKEIVPVLVKLF